ncbi:hypothetical protein CS063_16040 [Sporanaerobium hydrogeniformans]|uniref:Uncharacterized protein n=1 Tax=Sporanaerobium hydrogeniformans TaxID=3072179 RepID=A0AC61D6X4_9FIRM|nr:hypothetical protein [Sporanaerobium hydrogeniformans]PHV69391.1 hypothetical protein CS063_16040 [Sporanaerobium hydrogeniformans]
MRRYARLSEIRTEELQHILNYLFTLCDKVNIYFPNTCSTEVATFKEKFLAATHIAYNLHELSSLEEALEEKEGFSMIIASLTEEVKALLLGMKPNLHLDLGLISGEKVLFYWSDEDECVIETDEDSDVFDLPLFNQFKHI